MARCGGCTRVVIPPGSDVDALVHAPVAGALSDTHRANWAAGLPTVGGLFANNQGDPTSVIVAGDYSTIQGGEGHSITGTHSAIVAGEAHTIVADHAFIGGGDPHSITGDRSGIVAGRNLTITDAEDSFMGGGVDNLIDDLAGNANFRDARAIIGGLNHIIRGVGSYRSGIFVGGGDDDENVGSLIDNHSNGAIIAGAENLLDDFAGVAPVQRSVVLGGLGNRVRNSDSLIAGGTGNLVDGSTSFIGGGSSNTDLGAANALLGGRVNSTLGVLGNSAIAGGILNSIVPVGVGGNDFIGGGASNMIAGTSALENGIVAGESNLITDVRGSAIIAGDLNTISAAGGILAPNNSVIAGGMSNTIDQGLYALIAGGNGHLISVPGNGGGAAIVGGVSHTVSSPGSIAIGGSTGTVSIPNSGIVAGFGNTVGGVGGFAAGILAGLSNTVEIQQSAIAGGWLNTITSIGGDGDAEYSHFIGGGTTNTIDSGPTQLAYDDAIIGGSGNLIDTILRSAIAGGMGNTLVGTGLGSDNFMGGGSGNTMTETGAAAIIGGAGNSMAGFSTSSVILGGTVNSMLASSDFSVIAGGAANVVDHDLQFIASSGSALAGPGFAGATVIASAVGGMALAPYSVVIGGSFGSTSVADSISLSGGVVPAIATPGSLAHGATGLEWLGFRGAPPVAAPALSGFLPTGIPGLDAVITALTSQGLAV